MSGGDFPHYCDFACPHARFGDPAASGACRRDIAVWCALAARWNNKHARCLAARGELSVSDRAAASDRAAGGKRASHPRRPR